MAPADRQRLHSAASATATATTAMIMIPSATLFRRRNGLSLLAGSLSRAVWPSSGVTSLTSPTKRYPRRAWVAMNFCSPGASPNVLRTTNTFWVRLASSTAVSGHTRLIKSSFSTTRPRFSTSASSVSSAFGLIGIGSPFRSRRRRWTSMRKPAKS